MTLDYWAHRHWDDPKLAEEVVMAEEDYQAELARMEAEAIAQDGRELPEAVLQVPVPPPDDDEWEDVPGSGGM